MPGQAGSGVARQGQFDRLAGSEGMRPCRHLILLVMSLFLIVHGPAALLQPDGRVAHFELVLCKSVDTYVRVKQNQNQASTLGAALWGWQGGAVWSPGDPATGSQVGPARTQGCWPCLPEPALYPPHPPSPTHLPTHPTHPTHPPLQVVWKWKKVIDDEATAAAQRHFLDSRQYHSRGEPSLKHAVFLYKRTQCFCSNAAHCV